MLEAGPNNRGTAESTTGLEQVLNHLAATSLHTRDKGDKLERLMLSVFRTDPQYAQRYSKVWRWEDWPGRGSQPDTGIDLVAEERDTGNLIAIQCKFYDSNHVLQKGDIDSFFTASGKHPFKGRMIVSTTDRWSKHAEEALDDQQIPVTRLRLQDLQHSPIDWTRFTIERPDEMALTPKKTLRPHQRIAHEKVIQALQTAERGKLIMACGTGKTFTSLKIAETMAGQAGHVLFLMPSISLLSQTLREWTGDAETPLRAFAVCSDTKVGRSRDDEDLKVHDLAFPATTDAQKLYEQLCRPATDRMTVVFSTYQSIQVVIDAQTMGLPEFDLVIADEAHRTTGAMLQGEERSAFTKVHDAEALRAKKRLYMTATPRLYSDDQVARAAEKEALLWSMDDPEHFGDEIHRLGFGESVAQGLLSDYKVMILAVDENYISKAVQRLLSSDDNELSLDDAVKIVGCWNGLAKRTRVTDDEDPIAIDPRPMKRAVAFAGSIKASTRIADMFAEVANAYLAESDAADDLLVCEAEHVDGTFNALRRNARLDWLKEPTPSNTCRILTNARCLSEGVDVPNLDAVLFLQPRDSEIDIVQAVGRIMRKAEGKEYGYVILPIGVPAGVKPEEALSDNKKYKVVWQVLQALRAHDERFDSTINKLELNKKKPAQVSVIGVGGETDGETEGDGTTQDPITFNLENIGEWREAIYARIVDKVGSRRYWESWARDVAQIAERHIARISGLLEDGNREHTKAFDVFLAGLRRNLNPAISRDDAIEMLAQHLVTKPVFDALFEEYSFTEQNPVSIAMQGMIDLLETQRLGKETQTLERFYESVRLRAKGIDNTEGKQRIIVELYNKFFKTAFPRMAERLGIVYTPVEVVDFMLHSVDHALQQEFGVALADEGIHILDPFTGTGTFVARLLQSGLIGANALPIKYASELHANELVLLAYYIAAVNIEETFHELTGEDYRPFEGIVLTDTFQMTEATKGRQPNTLFPILPENSERAMRQLDQKIQVIVGNPPYSAGQSSANDANQNIKYPSLDAAIAASYGKHSTATNPRFLYDSYIRSIRWATDRVGERGIICFVTNGAFIDTNSADGLRKALADDFSKIYVLNLRGNQRTSGEISRKEGGKVFDSGSRAPIAVTLMVKDSARAGPATIHYHDIGDYLSRDEKLKTLRDFGSIARVPWTRITPNKHYDWVNQRGADFPHFLAVGSKRDPDTTTIFGTYSLGVATNRDAWVYNFSARELERNARRLIDNYNDQVASYLEIPEPRPEFDEVASHDPSRIAWSRGLKSSARKGILLAYRKEQVRQSIYRPFTPQHMYYGRDLNEVVSLTPGLFPTTSHPNLLISVSGRGGTREFSTLMLDMVPDLNLQHSGTQCFPLYWYEPVASEASKQLRGQADAGGYVRYDAVTDEATSLFRKTYATSEIQKEDIFYYVYGVFNAPEYRDRFGADLRRELPRVPFAQDFGAFTEAGRSLAKLHVGFLDQPLYPLTVRNAHSDPTSAAAMRIEKMRFGRNGKSPDRTTIIFNKHVTIGDIPLEAYEYQVNGKSAIEWIMDRYQVTVDKATGIKNDPNDWSDDPCHIVDLLQKIVYVSVETVRIVKAMPPLNELQVSD